MSNKALVTVVIGEYTTEGWKRWFLPTWEQYARKHGYDIVVLDDYVDGNPKGRTPNWQKLRILEHPKVNKYEHVVWLDADILINHHTAPCVVEHHDSDRVGLVCDKEVLRIPLRIDNLAARLHRIVGPHAFVPLSDIYRKIGLDETVDDYSNTGVMVLRTSRHRSVLEHIYTAFEEKPGSAKEEVPTSWYLHGNGLTKGLDKRFNQIWIWEMLEHQPHVWRRRFRLADNPQLEALLTIAVNTVWHNSWFLHFTADGFRDNDGVFYSCREDVRFVRTDCASILDFDINQKDGGIAVACAG